MERQLKMNMQTQSIVPDVIAKYPPNIMSVTYPDDVKVDMGNFLTPTQVKEVPYIEFPYETGCFYTLCMTDPDAPSRESPKFREWHHWLVGNIPNDSVRIGEVLSEYIGSGPPEKTGYHRYVFIAFKQPKKLQFDEERLKSNSAKNRGNFSILKFAEKYELGDPVAGNFFQAKFDEYVPILHRQINCC